MDIARPDDEENQNHTTPHFTWRAVLAGLIIGFFINLSNTYYGLRIGAASQMSIVSALLGFVTFQFLQRYLRISLNPSENSLLLSVSTSVGCMPVAAGFINVIPALEFLLSSEEKGPLLLSAKSLIVWSIGLCFFGLLFAAVFRNHFVVQEKLPWPGAKRAANLINSLYHQNPQPSMGHQSARDEANRQPDNEEDTDHSSFVREEQALLTPQPTIDGFRWDRGKQSLFRGTLLSWGLGMIVYFVPVLRKIPVFGRTASKNWLWSVDLSPGFFGQGMMTGPTVPLHTMMGAVAGWGTLSPYAKKQGWAPGSIDDWENGARGWIIWVALASLLADAFVKLGWFIWREVVLFSDDTAIMDGENEDEINTDHDYPSSMIGRRRLIFYFLVSAIICAVSVHATFGSVVPWYYTGLALTLALPTAVVGIRSIAETDHNPECALVSHLVFGTFLSSSNPNAILINLFSAAVSQAGASQSGDISHNFRIGQLVGSSPKVQLYGHIIGSIFGAFVSCGAYRLYASQHSIPGPLFRIPAAFLFINTARVAIGHGLPEGVAPFAIVAAVFSGMSTIVKMRYANRWWQTFIPTGVSFAIGIYNTPSFTITRIMGAVFYWACANFGREKGRKNNDLLVLASGLVLGESVASLTGLVSTMMFKRFGGH
ncbi:OPT superfamily [Podospora pseudopauciseta]|uniref:OPT superfamily n=1 Tax=Podospora pseudopauciseta TaxID=2093780 RepID=A0ABR0I416_9PEZI|nr:OPT superfamily [Podospora pseudopauciseta]